MEECRPRRRRRRDCSADDLCPDTTVNGIAIAGNDVTVVRNTDGAQVGTIDTVTGVVTVPAGGGGSCPVDLDIYIDGVLAAQETGLDPCTAETINIVWT